MATSAPPSRKRVVLLGATGSIGENTLRVIAAHPDKLELFAIARTHGVRHVGLFDDDAFAAARAHPAAFPADTRLVGGLAGLVELAQLPGADIVLVAVVGTTG
ncbi:MAG: 1-deoxy-D-xylulose-5-phosphate reductoisomerase, partial [Opitutaceae bacterium]|nr:1-deoxy-D-xylulose-5-phosphate reductoisomerase [Opitutaceae bacterium]